MWALIVVVGLVAVLLFVLRGSPELARLELRGGKLAHVGGRLPPRLLADFIDVLCDAPMADADVRIVLDDGRPRVLATGLSEDALQQLRNVTGGYQVAQFRAGRVARRQ